MNDTFYDTQRLVNQLASLKEENVKNVPAETTTTTTTEYPSDPEIEEYRRRHNNLVVRIEWHLIFEKKPLKSTIFFSLKMDAFTAFVEY